MVHLDLTRFTQWLFTFSESLADWMFGTPAAKTPGAIEQLRDHMGVLSARADEFEATGKPGDFAYACALRHAASDVDAILDGDWCHCGAPASHGNGWCTPCKFSGHDTCECSQPEERDCRG